MAAGGVGAARDAMGRRPAPAPPLALPLYLLSHIQHNTLAEHHRLVRRRRRLVRGGGRARAAKRGLGRHRGRAARGLDGRKLQWVVGRGLHGCEEECSRCSPARLVPPFHSVHALRPGRRTPPAPRVPPPAGRPLPRQGDRQRAVGAAGARGAHARRRGRRRARGRVAGPGAAQREGERIGWGAGMGAASRAAVCGRCGRRAGRGARPWSARACCAVARRWVAPAAAATRPAADNPRPSAAHPRRPPRPLPPQAPPPMTDAVPAAALVRPCLEAIVEAAAGRKFNDLRHEARVSTRREGRGWKRGGRVKGRRRGERGADAAPPLSFSVAPARPGRRAAPRRARHRGRGTGDRRAAPTFFPSASRDAAVGRRLAARDARPCRPHPRHRRV